METLREYGRVWMVGEFLEDREVGSSMGEIRKEWERVLECGGGGKGKCVKNVLWEVWGSVFGVWGEV